ncbi:MAG: 4-oxalocrotonate decarboxylase [Deltaproteobacteria bacterium]|nr:4-oxalocrotonate decarboxylase [Deltaproteobacteria bacterium]
MKRNICSLFSILMIVLCFVGPSTASEQDVIAEIVAAREAVKSIPLPSSKLPNLTEEKAYVLQKQMAEKVLSKGEKIGGFKAGLTSNALQQRFGVGSAVLGPMFKSGELGPDAVVDVKGFTRLFIETEVGYVVGEKITQPVKDVASLKKMIKEVFPAVELPDIRFAEMKDLKGIDLIVDAVSSSKYIVGKSLTMDKVDVDQVQVSLALDGKVVNEGKAADAMGDQWKALLWLVNGVIAQGWSIEPGQVLITGAMGNMIPGKPGKYEGDWGPLGKLSWTVK